MYSSDITDDCGEQKHFPAGKRAGRLRVRSARDMVNAIFYVQATGRQWRALPKDYPLCKQVCNPSVHSPIRNSMAIRAAP